MLSLDLPARANDGWNEARELSGAVANAPVQAAEATLRAAGDAVDQALAALNAAQAEEAEAQTAAETAAAVAAVAEAEAAVTAAAAALTGAAAALEGAVTVAAAVGAATLTTQASSWILSTCWDPVCNLHASTSAGFVPATLASVQGLLPTLTSATGGVALTQADFAAAGPVGQLADSVISESAMLFIDAGRGAAAASAGNHQQVLQAIATMQPLLAQYRQTIAAFAGLLASTSTGSPIVQLTADAAAFDAAAAKAISVCAPGGGDDCNTLATSLGKVSASLHGLLAALSTVSFPSQASLWPQLTLTGFEQFLQDTATIGAAALPSAEVPVAETLLQASNVSFGGSFDVGGSIAAWDAQGLAGDAETSLFDPTTGTLTLSGLFLGAATTLSANGYWLNIDLSQSPLVNTPEPHGFASVAVWLAGLVGTRAVGHLMRFRHTLRSYRKPRLS
jgi:hypothetical protein